MSSRPVLSFVGTRAGFVCAFDDLRRLLDARSIEPRARYNCELAFEEVVTNIIKYGYRDDREHRIQVAIDFSETAIVMRVDDDAAPFNPLQHNAAPAPSSIEDAPIGGRGLTLLRKAAARLQYERTADHLNRLTITIAAHA